MIDWTLLTREQVEGSSKLDVLKEFGVLCNVTGFAKILGCINSNYFTKSSDGNGQAFIVFSDGCKANQNFCLPYFGIRPVLSLSQVSSQISEVKQDHNANVKYFEYGVYPRTPVDQELSTLLEMNYKNGGLTPTGGKYTTLDVSYSPVTNVEYMYYGSKYIRYEVRQVDERKKVYVSFHWIKVEPIKWLIDEKAGIAVAEEIIFSGVPLTLENYYDENFETTIAKKFMNDFLSKEIVQSMNYTQNNVNQVNNSGNNYTYSNVNQFNYDNNNYTQEEQYQADVVGTDVKVNVKEVNPNINNRPTRKQNPYNLNFDMVSEEDIIRGAVESNIAVFLHGDSGDGKSARVEQLDPDLVKISLGSMSYEAFMGVSVYDSANGENKDIPPTWYTELVQKCSDEPNKIHILFLDELTNALPSIQGMAYDLVLYHSLNRKFKLPSNARIVAAGNETRDSLAANEMVEPLYNRVAHVYICTTVDSWLKWASTPDEMYERLDYVEDNEPRAKIHPAIYAYIAYKSYSNQDVLRTPYTGVKPNADPRKWEMASKVLYKTGQPQMLRALVGEELTADFIAFTKQQVITVEDVINHNYSSVDLQMDISQKFATAVGLSSVDEEHFEVVRDFMKLLGAEARAAFESMWVHGDVKRLEKLQEVTMAENFSHGARVKR